MKDKKYAVLSKQITDFGVTSDVFGDKFYIYFTSSHNTKTFYLAEGCVTENIDEALATEDINFAIDELGNLLFDQEFIDYVEGEITL